MSTNYSPTIVTDGAVFVGDARDTSTATAGSRLYDQANVDSTDVKLLIHGNEGSGQSFTDSSLSNHTITAVGDVTHSTAQSKFSGGSIYYDDSGDYLSIPASTDWVFSGDFTIDFWCYIDSTQSSNYSHFFTLTSQDIMSFKYSLLTNALYLYTGGTDITCTVDLEDAWHHVALVRSGTGSNNLQIFVDGVSQVSASKNDTWGNATGTAYIGWGWTTEWFKGYMDEMRVTQGAALWTQNFTPPARRDTLSISDGMMYNGTCVNFDGTDEQVYTGDGPGVGFGALSSNDDVTLSAWINVDTTGDMGVVSIGNVFMSIIVNGGYLEARCYNSGSQLTNTDAHPIVPNQWCHVAGVFSGGNVTLYKDGVATAAVACSNQSLAAASAYFQIGKGYTSGYLWMDGEIASPMAFDTALSASQIKEIYQDSKVIIPSNVSQTNLRGWWTFADGVGEICYDGSGRGIHGEFQNMESADWSTGQTGAPQLVEGYNRPMLFDGSSDYVSIADSATLSVGSTFTISYWFYPEDITTESYHIAKNTYTGNQKSYAVIQYSTGKTQFRISGNGSTHIECTGDTVMSNKAWHHIVHVFDGGAGTKLKGWVDGTAQSFNQQPNVTAAYDSTSILCLGTRDAGLVAPFAGIINEVIIYNSALDATDAAALYATGPNGGPLPPDPRTMSYSSSTTSANIMGYWRNDNNVTLTDLSGNSNTGTAIGSPVALLFKQGINGSASTSTGRDGQGFPLKYQNNGAVGFPFVGGVDDVGIKIAGINPTDFSYITVSAWVKIAAHSNWGTIAMQTDNNSFDEGWGLNISGSTNNLTFWVDLYSDSATADVSSHYGKWLHVVGTYNGTDQKLYFNGVEVSSNADTWTNKGAATNEIHVGAGIGTSNTALKYGLDGQIGNIQIYNRALSVTEIIQNYNAQKSRFT